MRKASLTGLALAGLLAAGSTSAQTLIPIGRPTATVSYSFGFNFSHRIAVSDSGWMWTILHKVEKNKPDDLVLYFSPDKGRSWLPVPKGSTPTSDDYAYAGLAAGGDCKTLHVAWTAKDPVNKGLSVFYQAFDTKTMRWIGKPLEIAKAAGPGAQQAQYRYQDINVSPKGRVVISVLGHRNCPAPYNGNWHCAMYVRQPGAATFDKPFRFNKSTTGQSAEVCLWGEVIFSTSKVSAGPARQCTFRAYDMDAKKFIAGPIHVGGTAAGDPQEATRNSVILPDGKGGVYVFYGIGNRAVAGKGELKVAYASSGNYTKWTRSTVAADPSMKGSASYTHYGMVLLPGNMVMLVYSKFSESYRNLYFRYMRDGKLLTPEAALFRTAVPGRFTTIVTLKGQDYRAGLYALVKNKDGRLPGTEVDFLSNAKTAGFGRYLGYGCVGKSKPEPKLAPQVLPEAGRPFVLEMTGLASGSWGVLLIGANCLGKPLDLTFLGAPGCGVFQDILITMVVASTSGGTAKVSFNLPSSVAGGWIRFQSAALVPGANQANLLTSRSLVVYP